MPSWKRMRMMLRNRCSHPVMWSGHKQMAVDSGALKRVVECLEVGLVFQDSCSTQAESPDVPVLELLVPPLQTPVTCLPTREIWTILISRSINSALPVVQNVGARSSINLYVSSTKL